MTTAEPRNLRVLVVYPNHETMYVGADDVPDNWAYLVAGEPGVIDIGFDVFGIVCVDAERKGRPENKVATELVRRLHPLLLGPRDAMFGAMVVVGSINPATGNRDGNFYDVPERISDLFKNAA